ncbi:MAG: ComF family protein [Lewinellaceae bacterium]|nr:ComF family protein [Lewinellaceae bacterium]
MGFHLTLPTLREMCEGFLHLLFPEICVACGQDLPVTGSCFCLKCQLALAPSDMYMQRENEFTDRFWGRLPLEGGAALYHFTRKSPVQRALHQLKYHNKPDIGVKIGREFGKKLRDAEIFRSVEAIIPVPLHPKKERLRGYNQSLMFAQGIAETMYLPVLNTVLTRNKFTASQTRKKRIERFQNVEQVFTVKKPALVEGRHLLLVDDVLTTGATLEICGLALLEVPGTRLSLATIAIACISLNNVEGGGGERFAPRRGRGEACGGEARGGGLGVCGFGGGVSGVGVGGSVGCWGGGGVGEGGPGVLGVLPPPITNN